MSSYNTSDRTYGKKALKLNEMTDGEFTIIVDFCREHNFLDYYNQMCAVIEEEKLEEGWLFGHHKVVKTLVLRGIKEVIEKTQLEMEKVKEDG